MNGIRHLPLLLLSLTAACAGGAPQAADARGAGADVAPPFAGALRCDELIRPGERHFAGLWKLTAGIENAAEAYWSFAGDQLVLQITPQPGSCDRIYVLGGRGGLEQTSSGAGVTTCAYFLPGDRRVVYASTHAFHQDCPPPADRSQGYVWTVHPEYDLYVEELESGAQIALTSEWGYDAEATVSPRGDRMVFTSSRSGDLELWTCDLTGGNLFQVTHTPGYDGGAFFSNSGEWLIFRATAFTPGKQEQELADYRRLLASWMVRPSNMELMLIKPDGTGRRQLTHLGKANFAPFFFPDDRRVIFASNHHDEKRGMPNFDLFVIGVDGKGLERVTFDEDFDSFPVFSPDGKWLAFSSNRGGTKPGETNLFVARWRD